MEYGLVVLWWLTYVGLALFGLPITAHLFSSLPGRGAGFSLAISLTIVTLAAFWVGFLSLGWVALGAGLIVLALGAVLASRMSSDINYRAAAEVLCVFTLVFVAVLIVRSVDPGITPQGEKFLDYGLMVSLYRSSQLPPEDFWFAGKPLIYYYGGHFLASLLTRLTSTPPWFGFNLAIAGFFGMLASGAYELAGSIAARQRQQGNRLRGISTSSHTERTRLIEGATAVFATICAGNISTAARVFVRNLPTPIRSEAVEMLASAHSELPAYQILRQIPADYQYKVAGRIIPKMYNPFPLFAIIRGDLRPYLLSTPFLLVVIGICYSYYCTPERAIPRRRALLFCAIPIVTGLMAIANTWSIGVVCGLVWLTLTFSPASPCSLLPSWTPIIHSSSLSSLTDDTSLNVIWRLGVGIILTGIACLIGVFVALPFFVGPVSSSPSSSLLTVPAEARSPLGSLLLVHGGFLVVIVLYLLARIRTQRTNTIAGIGVFCFVVLLIISPQTLAPLILFGLPLLAGGYILITDRNRGFEGILVVAGLGLVLLCELFFIQDGNGRFNTVVKAYMPTWILWACATGVVLPKLVRGREAWSWTNRRQQVGTVFASLLLISMAVYGSIALPRHFTEPGEPDIDQPSLDGMAAAERNIPGQVEAIRWLYNRSGRPTLVSTPVWKVYRWSASPAASLTGLPTIVGVSHEAQYRGREAFFNRVAIVNTIYLGSAKQRVYFLNEYDVEYIYVGPTERIKYQYIRPFDGIRGISVAFQAGSVTIYEVNQERLSAN